MTVFYYKAFEYLNVAIVTMLLFTYPIIIFIYSIIFQKQKVHIKKLLAITMAFLGCALSLNILSGNVSFCLQGVIFGLLSAVFYAFMNLYSEKKLKKVDSLCINTYSTLFSLISLMIYRQPKVFLQTHINYPIIMCILALAIFCEIIPLTLLYKSIQYIGSLKVSIIGNLEIPTAMLISSIFLKESITAPQIIGAVIIICAVHIIKE